MRTATTVHMVLICAPTADTVGARHCLLLDTEAVRLLNLLQTDLPILPGIQSGCRLWNGPPKDAVHCRTECCVHWAAYSAHGAEATQAQTALCPAAQTSIGRTVPPPAFTLNPRKDQQL